MQTKEELTLNDKIKFDTKGGSILGVLEGPVADFVHPTRNGRLYSKELWEKVLKNPIVKEQFANGGIPGELDHPADREDICSEKIAVLMPEPPVLKNGEYWGKFHILDTPCGRIVYTLAKAGFKLGVSSRGTGDVDDYTNTVDPDSYDFTCFDVVLLPAVKDARMNLVTESIEKETDMGKALKEVIEPIIKNEKEDKGRKIMKETLNHLVEDTKKKTCVICGKEFEGYGNNAEPVASGLCCDVCNKQKVIPARLDALKNKVDSGVLEEAKEKDKGDEVENTTKDITTDSVDVPAELPTDVSTEGADEVPTGETPIEDNIEETTPEICIDDAKLSEFLHAFLEKEGLELDGEGTEESDFIELFHEIVCPNCVDQAKEKSEPVNDIEVEKTSEEAEDIGSNELIEQLQNLLKENSKLKEELKTIQSEKAVRNTEVSKLNEQLTNYKAIAASAGKKALSLKSLETTNADLKKENASLKESLTKNKTDTSTFVNKITSLTESLKDTEAKAKASEAESGKIKNEFETYKKSITSKLNEANARITKAKKLIEKYKGFAHDAADRYIERRALGLGISKNEIINRLSESYTLDDVDRVCSDLQSYSLNVSTLPFALQKTGGARAQIRESTSKDPLRNVDKDYDDEVDDFLLDLAGIKK
jgi:hypothetical protein